MRVGVQQPRALRTGQQELQVALGGRVALARAVPEAMIAGQRRAVQPLATRTCSLWLHDLGDGEVAGRRANALANCRCVAASRP